MRVNFFVMFPAGADARACRSSYICAFRAPPRSRASTAALSREFPNITNVDVSASIAQVQGVLDQVIRAVEFLFTFTLAAGPGGAVRGRHGHARGACARVRAHARDGRAGLAAARRCSAPSCWAWARWRACWPRRGAVAVGWALARYAFQFDWNPSPWVPLAGRLPGALLALAGGLVGAARRAAPARGGDAAPGSCRLRSGARWPHDRGLDRPPDSAKDLLRRPRCGDLEASQDPASVRQRMSALTQHLRDQRGGRARSHRARDPRRCRRLASPR
jgi:hypothetical protein